MGDSKNAYGSQVSSMEVSNDGLIIHISDKLSSIIGGVDGQYTMLSDITCNDFHILLLSFVKKQYEIKHIICPFKTSQRSVAWFYGTVNKTDDSSMSFRLDLISVNDLHTNEYNFMKSTYDMLNSYTSLYNEFDIKSRSIEFEISKLNSTDNNIKISVSDIKQKQDGMIDILKDNEKAFQKLEREIKQQLSSHTSEMVKLMHTDSMHNKQIESFEKAISDLSNKAIEKLETNDSESNEAIKKIKKESESNNTKNFMASVVLAILLIVQLILQLMLKK